ncbi:hypothetical protein CNR33_00049 [Pseudomonas phage tabernarius]|uniref:Uncharacterized protein n=1 Tax=Pseudomonas phage tabernarius TaxID=2048978 RepID=A0A2H4P6U3_9CAUD|nr:tail fiber protein [Pseudomonas phage tabernarius]ATW57895.1 hypothetical protein CNR33_00049 [Pseudomonas phage tabernarius]
MENIGGHGTSITIVALNSFPVGFQLTKLADDVDPISHKEVTTNGYKKLIDGSLFFYSQTAPIEVSVSVVPGSDDDINCKILLQAQKGGLQIIPLPDITTMIITYPKGRVLLTNGSIVSGPLLDSIADTARKKSNTYTFVFANFAGMQNGKETITTVLREAMSFF